MNYYNEIKTEILNNEINKRVKTIQKKLSKELNKKYGTRLLYKMLRFYNYCNLEIFVKCLKQIVLYQ